jgi:hypothetical protein
MPHLDRRQLVRDASVLAAAMAASSLAPALAWGAGEDPEVTSLLVGLRAWF